MTLCPLKVPETYDSTYDDSYDGSPIYFLIQYVLSLTNDCIINDAIRNYIEKYFYDNYISIDELKKILDDYLIQVRDIDSITDYRKSFYFQSRIWAIKNIINIYLNKKIIPHDDDNFPSEKEPIKTWKIGFFIAIFIIIICLIIGLTIYIYRKRTSEKGVNKKIIISLIITIIILTIGGILVIAL
jgi:multisubunit Na+/H+ antiporter MnhB subunit